MIVSIHTYNITVYHHYRERYYGELYEDHYIMESCLYLEKL